MRSARSLVGMAEPHGRLLNGSTASCERFVTLSTHLVGTEPGAACSAFQPFQPSAQPIVASQASTGKFTETIAALIGAEHPVDVELQITRGWFPTGTAGPVALARTAKPQALNCSPLMERSAWFSFESASHEGW
jgi:hypothetical protein